MTFSNTAKRMLSAVLFLIGVSICFAGSMVTTYQTAKFIPRIGLLVAMAMLVFFLGALLITQLVGKLSNTILNRNAVLTSAALTIFLALGLYFAVLRPTRYPHVVSVARANTQYWNLPTGSRIAFSEYEPPAGVALKAEPILFVHGGPGARAFDTDHAFYQQFAQDGFRIFLFDQAGSGLSDRLPVGEYTVERFVADIEAIRQQIGSERLILIGHSWGGTLAAHYAAAHPDHVAKSSSTRRRGYGSGNPLQWKCSEPMPKKREVYPHCEYWQLLFYRMRTGVWPKICCLSKSRATGKLQLHLLTLERRFVREIAVSCPPNSRLLTLQG